MHVFHRHELAFGRVDQGFGDQKIFFPVQQRHEENIGEKHKLSEFTSVGVLCGGSLGEQSFVL